MTLKEYAESINKLAEKYPDILVVYSSDDEGNNFQKVHNTGTLGFFDGDYHGDFISIEHIKEDPEYEMYKPYVNKEPNVVCIN